MEQTLAILRPEAGIADGRFEIPCDRQGVARAR
jgi:hypothetical protein